MTGMTKMMYRYAAQPDPLEADLVGSLAMFYASIGSGKEGGGLVPRKHPEDHNDTVKNDMPDF